MTLFLIGAAGMACVPIIQTRIMDVAHGAPTLAAAANHSAFNLANAAGAFLGGLAISAGLGWSAPNWVGAALTGVGLVLAVVSGALERHPEQSATAALAAKASGAGNLPSLRITRAIRWEVST